MGDPLLVGEDLLDLRGDAFEGGDDPLAVSNRQIRRPRWRASMAKAMAILVRALVEATAISGPAWR